MSIKVDPEFTKEILEEKLKAYGEDGYWMIPQVEFVFSQPGAEFLNDLNREFKTRAGPPAYDRRKLHLCMVYASIFEVDHDLTKVARLCRTDKILADILGNDRPCNVTFDNYLNGSNPKIMKVLSICSLIEFNDLKFLDFTRIFTDSTDAKINGSAHYKVSQDEIDGIKLMNKLNLLHNRSHKKNEKKIRSYY